jgi:hypothetical protein
MKNLGQNIAATLFLFAIGLAAACTWATGRLGRC